MYMIAVDLGSSSVFVSAAAVHIVFKEVTLTTLGGSMVVL